MLRIGRNDPCPCGSGKKYKKCCYPDSEKKKEIERALRKADKKEDIISLINEGIKVYVFKIILDSMRLEPVNNVWRVIEIKGDRTLYGLHSIIQEAFDWDDDHMFSFFLNNKIWDRDSEYKGNPLGECEPSSFDDKSKLADEAEIRDLGIRKGKKFKYLFDYGDELIHTIETIKIYENNEKESRFPRIIESKGKAPAQY